jgi:hypothetical protein
MVCSLRTFFLFLLVKKWLQKHQFQYSMPYVSELNPGSCDFMLLLFLVEICIHVRIVNVFLLLQISSSQIFLNKYAKGNVVGYCHTSRENFLYCIFKLRIVVD